MAPRITIIGGGSYQWAPKLLVDLANTRALHDAEVVLHDIDPAPLPRMVELAEHLAAVRGIALTARATTDRRAALEGADYVVVTISTGGFASMRHDLDIPARHGVQQSVGDTVGPRRYHAGAAQHPGVPRHRPRRRGAVPRRLAPQPHQPDDHHLPRAHARDAR